jgi:hypothetical protein
LPFIVGDINPEGSFIHVLDDATLDIAMHELDTIVDFASYLTKKEQLIRSGCLISAAGEEELIAYYLTHMSQAGEHDFTKPDGSDLAPNEHISIDVGFYEDMLRNKQYRAKKAADRTSYVWDRLIEAFTTHMLAGTTIVPDGRLFAFADLEEGVRHMALVPRYFRRNLGRGILDALRKGATAHRFTRGFLPGSDEYGEDTGFFFMTLAVPKFELEGGYEQYRAARRNMLETYALAILQKNPKLQRVVGIASEPPSGDRRTGSSEDLIMAEQPEWTPEVLESLEERKKIFGIFRPDKYMEYAIHDNEYPEVRKDASNPLLRKLTRAQRRARAAEARRQQRKAGKRRR